MPLREHHRHAVALAGPDGTLYVAEQPEKWQAGDTDGGAVGVYAPDGTLVRRLTQGIAGPTALALDQHGRLLVANSGSILDRGVSVTIAPTVSVYDRAAAPAATYPLPKRAFVRVLIVAPNGDLFVDTGQDAVSRVRPGDATPLRTFVTPHAPTVVEATTYPLDVRPLRMRGTDALVALFAGGNEPPFFAEWSLTDGRLLRRLAVPGAEDFAVDGAGRIVVATSDGNALVFPPDATAPAERWDTTPEVVATATDADGNVWFQGHDELVGLGQSGRRIAAYGLARMGAVALVDAPSRSSLAWAPPDEGMSLTGTPAAWYAPRAEAGPQGPHRMPAGDPVASR
jgi:hypothetical protein